MWYVFVIVMIVVILLEIGSLISYFMPKDNGKVKYLIEFEEQFMGHVAYRLMVREVNGCLSYEIEAELDGYKLDKMEVRKYGVEYYENYNVLCRFGRRICSMVNEEERVEHIKIFSKSRGFRVHIV